MSKICNTCKHAEVNIYGVTICTKYEKLTVKPTKKCINEHGYEREDEDENGGCTDGRKEK